MIGDLTVDEKVALYNNEFSIIKELDLMTIWVKALQRKHCVHHILAL